MAGCGRIASPYRVFAWRASVLSLVSLFVVTTGVFSISFADDASVASEGVDFRQLAFRLTEAAVNGPSRIATVCRMMGRG